jgi:hypothetical protein
MTANNTPAKTIADLLHDSYQQAKAAQPDIDSRFAYSNASNDVIEAYRSGYEHAKDEMLSILLELAQKAGVTL